MLVNMHHARNTCDLKKLQQEIADKGIALYGAYGVNEEPHRYNLGRTLHFFDKALQAIDVPGLDRLMFCDTSVYYAGTPETFQTLMLDTQAWTQCHEKFFAEQFTLTHPVFGPLAERYLQGEEVEEWGHWGRSFCFRLQYTGFESLMDQYLASLPTPDQSTDWSMISESRTRMAHLHISAWCRIENPQHDLKRPEVYANEDALYAEWQAHGRRIGNEDNAVIERKVGLYGTTQPCKTRPLFYALPNGFTITIDRKQHRVYFHCTAQDVRWFMENSGLMAHRHELDYRVEQMTTRTHELTDYVLAYITGSYPSSIPTTPLQRK